MKDYFPYKDKESTEIICNLMKRLYQAPLPIEGFPTIQNWLTALDRGKGVPSEYLQKARILKEKLLKDLGEPKLLHGDLHHYNCLTNSKEWIVIDPKGVIGEIAYEVAAFIRNPIPDLLNQPNALEIVASRIQIFSQQLNLNSTRIYQWCFIQSVLSWIWALEDGTDEDYFVRLTQFFDKLVTV